MKKLIFALLANCLLQTANCFSQGTGFNTTGANPNASAGVDIDFSNKGLLIPRVNLTSLTDVTTITSPASSLLVFNTNAAMSGGAVGYWSWSGSSWVQLATLSPGTGFSKLLYHDETSASFTTTTPSVKSWTIVGSYSEIKIEADIEYNNLGALSAAGFFYEVYYNGVLQRTATLRAPPQGTALVIESGSVSFTGPISNGQVVRIDVTQINTPAPATGYIRNFRVYGIY